MTREEFLFRFGAVFENAPDLVAAVFDRGLPPPPHTPEALHRVFLAVLHGLPEAALIRFLNGHPELAGAALEQGVVTAESAGEQTSAGLAALDGDSRARFRAMNAAYRARFGFPFIMAVRGVPAAEVLAAFEARLARDPATERAEALRQIGRILLLRLYDRMASATGR